MSVLSYFLTYDVVLLGNGDKNDRSKDHDSIV